MNTFNDTDYDISDPRLALIVNRAEKRISSLSRKRPCVLVRLFSWMRKVLS